MKGHAAKPVSTVYSVRYASGLILWAVGSIGCYASNPDFSTAKICSVSRCVLAADERSGIGSCSNSKLADQCSRLPHLPSTDSGSRGLWRLLDLCIHHCMWDRMGLHTAARDERCDLQVIFRPMKCIVGSKGLVSPS